MKTTIFLCVLCLMGSTGFAATDPSVSVNIPQISVPQVNVPQVDMSDLANKLSLTSEQVSAISESAKEVDKIKESVGKVNSADIAKQVSAQVDQIKAKLTPAQLKSIEDKVSAASKGSGSGRFFDRFRKAKQQRQSKDVDAAIEKYLLNKDFVTAARGRFRPARQ